MLRISVVCLFACLASLAAAQPEPKEWLLVAFTEGKIAAVQPSEVQTLGDCRMRRDSQAALPGIQCIHVGPIAPPPAPPAKQ